MDLVPYREPQREPIYVRVPHLECEVEGCDRPLAADMVWHQINVALHHQQICGVHLVIFRDWVRQKKGAAVFFPLNGSPPLQRIGAWLEQEIRRRQPPVYQPTWGGNIGYSYQQGTTSGWTHIRFG